MFDKEIAPGIFTPSAPVPNYLADEYRRVSGTLGVIVHGSVKNEMTPEEIRGELDIHGPVTNLPADSDLSQWEIQFRDATGKLPATLGLDSRIAARDWLEHGHACQDTGFGRRVLGTSIVALSSAV